MTPATIPVFSVAYWYSKIFGLIIHSYYIYQAYSYLPLTVYTFRLFLFIQCIIVHSVYTLSTLLLLAFLVRGYPAFCRLITCTLCNDDEVESNLNLKLNLFIWPHPCNQQTHVVFMKKSINNWLFSITSSFPHNSRAQ